MTLVKLPLSHSSSPEIIPCATSGQSNLFLASTPLQIINAMEARDRFHAGERNYLVMVHSPRIRSRHRAHFFSMTDSLIDNAWSRVWNMKLTRISQLFFAVTARQIRSEIGSCECVYTGGFQTQQCHLINTVKHQRLIMLDGGACIHSVPDMLRRGSQRKRLRAFMTGMRSHLRPNTQASYFTSYDLAVDPQKIIRNDYRIMRERMQKSLPQRDEIVFISQPLERDLHVYINTQAVIQSAMSYHNVSAFRYILHPREKLEPFGSERLPHLIELFGLMQGYLPRAFVTYMSSAARSLQLIYGVPVTCYNMMPCLPASSHPETLDELQKVYDDFRRSGITVLDVPRSAYIEPEGGAAMTHRSREVAA